MLDFLNLFINLDQNLLEVINQYGILIYPLLFFIIFFETGLVIMPFLPGDSLLFVAGAIASTGSINIFLIFVLMSIAAILGDSVNYYIGKYVGKRVISNKYKKSLERTEKFYKKHGGKTIILARFVPIIRTFAPFVAGVAKMKYSRFLKFNIIGGILWVVLLASIGFFFGNLPFIKNHFSLVIVLIILISLIPVVVTYIQEKLKKRDNLFPKPQDIKTD
jgi:membrane-associated protein